MRGTWHCSRPPGLASTEAIPIWIQGVDTVASCGAPTTVAPSQDPRPIFMARFPNAPNGSPAK
jgi:hypothetical protein